MTRHSYTEPNVRKISLALNGGCLVQQVSNSPEIQEDENPENPNIFDDF